MLHLHHQTIRTLFETGLLPGKPVRGEQDVWNTESTAIAALIASSEATPEGNWHLTYQVKESLQMTLDILYDLNRGVLERSHERYPDEVIAPIQAKINATIDGTIALIHEWDELIDHLHELQKSLVMPVS
jgi:hypothetical protein